MLCLYVDKWHSVMRLLSRSNQDMHRQTCPEWRPTASTHRETLQTGFSLPAPTKKLSRLASHTRTVPPTRYLGSRARHEHYLAMQAPTHCLSTSLPAHSAPRHDLWHPSPRQEQQCSFWPRHGVRSEPHTSKLQTLQQQQCSTDGWCCSLLAGMADLHLKTGNASQSKINRKCISEQNKQVAADCCEFLLLQVKTLTSTQ